MAEAIIIEYSRASSESFRATKLSMENSSKQSVAQSERPPDAGPRGSNADFAAPTGALQKTGGSK